MAKIAKRVAKSRDGIDRDKAYDLSEAVKLLRFTGEAPSRRLGLVWRRSSAAGAFLRKLAAVLRDLPPDLLRPPGAAAKRERKT